MVSSVVRCGDPKLVHPLSLAAAHCMGEVTLSTETRESEHKYPNDTVNEVRLRTQCLGNFFTGIILIGTTLCISENLFMDIILT